MTMTNAAQATAVLPSIGAARTDEIAARIARDLGAATVSRDPARIERLSVDWAHMSPILTALLPAGRADLVVTPEHADQVPAILRHAYDLQVPVTPRGTGLGNYGQAIPLSGGIVLDLSGCRAILDIGDGAVTTEAGARMRDIDTAVRGTGRELTMYPSTKGSTIGGFLAGGSGGTGSITYGTNADGFVLAADVVPCDGSGRIVHVESADALPYIHAYGTTGIIVRATIALAPRHDWVGVYTAWRDYAAATTAMAALRDLTPGPRLISLDEPEIVAVLPADPALDPARISVRAIVEATAVDAVRELVDAGGGEVLAVRTGVNGADRLTSLSFNHTTFHLQKKEPDYFHLEVIGDPLVTDPDRVRSVYPGTVLHLEQFATSVGGMLMARYESPEQVYAGMEQLQALGIGIHSPHTWTLDRRIEGIHAVLADMDPRGLLNPGKLLPETP